MFINLQVNICGSLGKGTCGTLQNKEPGACKDTTYLADYVGSLTFTDTGDISLTYVNSTAPTGMVIRLSDYYQIIVLVHLVVFAALYFVVMKWINVAGLQTKVVINFVCNQNVPDGEPKFVEQDGLTLVLEFQTALACRPEPVECKVYDNAGNSYDLSALMRPGSFWQVPDSRSGRQDLTYFINVCTPIGNAQGCPG